jgi:PAS domain S-box-containing protein
VARPPHVPQPETELEEFFDLSNDPMSIIGFDGEFKRVNASFVRLLGYPKPELFSRSALDILHPDDVEPAREALAQLAEGHDLVRFEARVICADGAVRWLEWSTRSMPERGVVYSVGRDTTERRRVEAELREAQRLLEASHDELRVLAKEQAALRRVATLVAQGVPSDALFGAVCDEVEAVVGADISVVVRFEADGTVTLMGTNSARHPVGARLELDPHFVVAEVHRTGRAARFDTDDPAASGMPAVVRAERVRSSLASPIVVEGELWGAISTGLRERRVAAGMERRLADFTELVATAISNLQARAELAASRARIAAAADDERRRVVRDLHDGAQQRLVHTVITLKLAQQALANGTENGPLLVQEAIAHAEQATAEVRELAHGILPAVLTHGGLPAGIDALASRAPVRVEIDVPVGRLPAPIEATAYFVVAEALTNVAKHASAGHAEVVARIKNRVLRVEVRDDGVGGASPAGTGLVGLADRLAVFDGRLEVDSPPGAGTRLTATFPLPRSDRSAIS